MPSWLCKVLDSQEEVYKKGKKRLVSTTKFTQQKKQSSSKCQRRLFKYEGSLDHLVHGVPTKRNQITVVALVPYGSKKVK